MEGVNRFVHKKPKPGLNKVLRREEIHRRYYNQLLIIEVMVYEGEPKNWFSGKVLYRYCSDEFAKEYLEAHKDNELIIREETEPMEI